MRSSLPLRLSFPLLEPESALASELVQCETSLSRRTDTYCGDWTSQQEIVESRLEQRPVLAQNCEIEPLSPREIVDLTARDAVVISGPNGLADRYIVLGSEPNDRFIISPKRMTELTQVMEAARLWVIRKREDQFSTNGPAAPELLPQNEIERRKGLCLTELRERILFFGSKDLKTAPFDLNGALLPGETLPGSDGRNYVVESSLEYGPLEIAWQKYIEKLKLTGLLLENIPPAIGEGEAWGCLRFIDQYDVTPQEDLLFYNLNTKSGTVTFEYRANPDDRKFTVYSMPSREYFAMMVTRVDTALNLGEDLQGLTGVLFYPWLLNQSDHD